jgi:hypothetical protein
MAQIPSADLPVVNKDTGRINLEWYAALQRIVSEIAGIGSGGVTSFEGRTGVVVGVAGDYSASEVTNNSGVGGANVDDALDTLDAEKQPIDADLTALAALASTGLVARTGAATYAERTVTGTANEISVANGDGVAGDPTLSLPATIDLGGKTSLEIPNSAAPTVDADGEIAVDTTVTDFSHGVLKYFSGEELGVVAMPIAQFTAPTDGHVVTYSGTNDEFVLSAGGGSGGAWVKISSVSASASASVSFTGLSSTYAAYVVVIGNLVPATDGANLLMRTDENGGASYDAGASDYRYSYISLLDNGATPGGARSAGATAMQLSDTIGNAGEENVSGFVYLHHTAGTRGFTSNWSLGRYDTGGSYRADIGGGTRVSVTTAIDAVQFLMSAGNITSGAFTLYGLTA